MQNNNKVIIKVNKKQNSSLKIPRPVKNPNKTVKINLTENKLKINTSLNKTPTNIKFKNFIPNTSNKKGNSTKNILLIDKTPKTIKKINYLTNNSKANTSQKLISKNKLSLTKMPSSKIINSKINIIQRTDSKNIKKVQDSQKGTGNRISRNNLYENKKEDRSAIYNKKIINNFVSKKSSELKLEEIPNRNEDKKIESLTSFGFNYYKDKIYIKKIFDYCINGKPEEHRDYQLRTNIYDYLDSSLYNSLYDFFILIRNNNNLLIKIINCCSNFSYADLSDFIVNFLYENIINSSFVQPELIILIYLLLEDLFSKINLINSDISIYKK